MRRLLPMALVPLVVFGCLSLDRSFEGTRCDAENTCGDELVCCEGRCATSCTATDSGASTDSGVDGQDSGVDGQDSGVVGQDSGVVGQDSGTADSGTVDAGSCFPNPPTLLGPANGRRFRAGTVGTVAFLWSKSDAGSVCPAQVSYTLELCSSAGCADGGTSFTTMSLKSSTALPGGRLRWKVNACAEGRCATSAERHFDAHRVIADFSGEGTSELLVVEGAIGASQIRSFLNAGGSSQVLTTVSAHPDIVGLTTGDCDGDGDEDLLVLERKVVSHHLHCLRDAVQTNTQKLTDLDRACDYGGLVNVGDVDADGTDDFLATCGPNAPFAATVAFGGGSQRRVRISLDATGLRPVRGSPLGDIDGDGLADLALFGDVTDGGPAASGVVLGALLQVGTGPVSALRLRPLYGDDLTGARRLGDADRDGRDEFVIGSRGKDICCLHTAHRWNDDGGTLIGAGEYGSFFGSPDDVLLAGVVGQEPVLGLVKAGLLEGFMTIPRDGGFFPPLQTPGAANGCGTTVAADDFTGGLITGATPTVFASCAVLDGGSNAGRVVSFEALPDGGVNRVTRQGVPTLGRLMNEGE